MSRDALIVRDLTKAYGRGARSTTVLHGISLVVPEGQFLAIMGPSGSGKSTFLNLIAGLDTPTSGTVLLAGHDLAAMSDDERSMLRLRSIGVVFQNFNLFPTFTVEENVMWPLEFLGTSMRDARARAHEALDRVGVPATTHRRRPAELSGGEQQRAAIARALVTTPALLLADEPTGNLDSTTGQLVLDLMRRLNLDDGTTVIIATHSALAATYGDRTVELRDGRIVRDVHAPREVAGRVVPLRE
jgi:putative ABC transport system ATP-binding protein